MEKIKEKIRRLAESEDYNLLSRVFEAEINSAEEKGDMESAVLWAKRGADQLSRAGQFYKSASFLIRAAGLYHNRGDNIKAGRFYFRAARSYEIVRAFSEASESYEKSALSFYNEGGNNIIETAKHYKLAALARIQSHDYERLEYIRYMDKSACIFKEAFDNKYLNRHDYFLYLENLYADAQNILYRNGYYRDVGNVYIKMMNVVKNRLRSSGHKSFFLYLWYVFWYQTSGYGERPLRWMCTILLCILAFSLTYWEFGLITTVEGVHPSFYDCIYFSINMFASLGFGNYALLTPITKLLIMGNVIFGYLMLAILLTIISRKITR